MKTAFYLLFTSFCLPLYLQAAAAEPSAPAAETTATTTRHAGHIIEAVFYVPKLENYVLVIDDGSIWNLSSTSRSSQFKIEEELKGEYIRLMPSASGLNESPHRLLIGSGQTTWVDASVLTYSKYGKYFFDRFEDGQLVLSEKIAGASGKKILAADSTAKEWTQGDPLIICGIWEREFDAQGRNISPCFSFSVYNYSKGEFCFIALPSST